MALSIELLSLGVAVAAEMTQSGVSRARSELQILLLASLIVVGAVIGLRVVNSLPETLIEAALSFGVAALLFLVTKELLVEAQEVPETAVTTTAFFAGFLLFLMIGILA